MALSLAYHGVTSVPVEIEGFTPDWACDKSLAEIERFEIFHGNCKIPLAEMFAVKGDASDKRFDFEGDLAGVHWIGAQMASGQIHIHGPAGRHIGSEMTGGEIHVYGDAKGWVGAEMKRGLIHVKGNAGHLVGSSYRGSAKGMTGGTILVDGNAGNEVGCTMRRGLIAIGGAAGDMVGFNMIAGPSSCSVSAASDRVPGCVAARSACSAPTRRSFYRPSATPRPTNRRWCD